MERRDLAGIDVSAKELTVSIDLDGKLQGPLSFANTPSGHHKLIRRLTQRGRCARVGLEASGIYSLDLALALHRAPGIEVMVINPRAGRDFARALLKRSKSDPIDAEVVLEFVRRMPFLPWQPPPAAALDLRALARRMRALIKALSQEKSRLHAARHCHELTAVVRNDIEVNLRHLERRIQRLEAQAAELIRQDPQLSRRLQLLDSVRGIALRSGVLILGELAVLPQDMAVRQWVAHTGLDPRTYESGASVHKPARISRVGNEYLRASLYMPALTAVRCEPHVRAFYEKLVARGKKRQQAIIAVMRKLLHAIYGMFKHDCPFDGQKFYDMPLQQT